MKKLHLTLFLLSIFNSSFAINLDKVRFHNQQNDTIEITSILIDTYNKNFKSPNECIGYIARHFLGLPYVAHTLEGDTEILTINIDELDCTTFVETVIAMAYSVNEGRTSWYDYIQNLERVRYRDGKLNGYTSRLHYISDWIVNNSHRNNFSEVTDEFPGYSYKTKTLDFMTSHRKSYTSLANDSVFEQLKNIEIGYHNHRFPYIKTSTLQRKSVRNNLKDGDIIALTTNIEGLDVSHMGLIAIVDGEPHLMHASMKAMKVIIDPLPLHKYLDNSKSLTGIRVIRLNH